MKRFFTALLLAISLLFPLCAAETDSQLFTRLSSAYDSGYYPAVLTLSEEFLSDFPHSQFVSRVYFIRGKSFFRLSRYSEAIKDFEIVADSNADASYWQGMAYYRQQNYEKASDSFYNALALSSGEDSSERGGYEFSKRSLLVYSAFSLDNCGRRDEAAVVIEYTLVNFSMEEDFQPAVQLLFSIYKDTNNKSRLMWLYRQISGVIDCFPEEWSHAMLYYMADAYAASGEYETALELFAVLLECNEKAYQAAALQNAYLIAEEKAFLPDDDRVFDAYRILEDAEKIFPEGDIQLCDLWMKLALRNWNDGEKETAMRCFYKADSCCSKALVGGAGSDTSRIQGYLELAGLYEADYLFNSGKTDDTVKLLQERADPSGMRYAEYMVQLARCSALTGRGDLCGMYASNAVERLEKQLAAGGNAGGSVSGGSESSKNSSDTQNMPESVRKLAGEAYFYKAYAASGGETSTVSGAASGAVKTQPDWKSVLAACRRRYEITRSYDYPRSLLFAESLLLADGSENAVAQAMDIFEAMSETENGIEFLSNRTKALLLTGSYETAYKLGGTVRSADAEKDDEFLYLMGLAATGCGVWKTASNLLGTDKPYGLYYTAYALYRQSRTDEAYPLFEQFYNENQYHLMARNACFYAAVCALQNDDSDNALAFAKLAVEKSVLADQKMEASVLCASIYNDKSMYAEAEALLEVYAPSSESVSLNLLLSQVYSAHAAVCKRNGEVALYTFLLEKADTLLSNTENYFKGIPESRAAAEEAAYRRAELYYSAAEYEKAAEIYELFRERYPESTFYVQSLFYNALSLKNSEREKEAILLFEKCASYNKYNDTFGFPALRQLIELYRNSMEYDMALTVAERALLEYPEESNYSGIAMMVQNLRLMVEGTDETIAALRTKYEEAGKGSTSAGRKSGFSLALEYMNSVSERNKGEEVLLDIINTGSSAALSDDDRFILGESYELLGLYYRQLGRESDATECYLSAAESFASVDKGKAAEVLYNAIDIFVAEGRLADAGAVYRTLVSLDSGSQWAKEASTLLGIFRED